MSRCACGRQEAARSLPACCRAWSHRITRVLLQSRGQMPAVETEPRVGGEPPLASCVPAALPFEHPALFDAVSAAGSAHSRPRQCAAPWPRAAVIRQISEGGAGAGVWRAGRGRTATNRRPGCGAAVGGGEKNPGSDLLSHAVTRAVPSAVEGLTAVFGMGTGVTPLLWPPGKTHGVPGVPPALAGGEPERDRPAGGSRRSARRRDGGSSQTMGCRLNILQTVVSSATRAHGCRAKWSSRTAD